MRTVGRLMLAGAVALSGLGVLAQPAHAAGIPVLGTVMDYETHTGLAGMCVRLERLPHLATTWVLEDATVTNDFGDLDLTAAVAPFSQDSFRVTADDCAGELDLHQPRTSATFQLRDIYGVPFLNMFRSVNWQPATARGIVRTAATPFVGLPGKCVVAKPVRGITSAPVTTTAGGAYVLTGLVPKGSYTLEADDCAGTPDAYKPGSSAPFRVTPGEQAAEFPITLTANAIAPGAPTTVKAKAGKGSATVTWTAAPGTVTHSIVRTVPAFATAARATGTSVTFNGLPPGKQFRFVVTSVNETAAGPESAPSKPVRIGRLPR